MIEDYHANNEIAEENTEQREVFSRAVRAGKRTYFFDVKATRRNDYFLTITESKKRFQRDGRFFYEKHKIYLYKEDLEKFADGFQEVIEFIGDGGDQDQMVDTIPEENDESTGNYTDVDFEDLENVEIEEGKHQR